MWGRRKEGELGWGRRGVGVEVQGTIDVLGEPGLVLVYCVSEGVGIKDEVIAEIMKEGIEK